MEKKNKKMMIDEELFRMLYQYFIYDREDLRGEIRKGLVEKMARLIDRDFYTKSLTADTDEERENNRIAYLNRKGIPEDFRW
ncbi:complexin-2 [Eubacterium sp.]|uniref:complexin-2 n=1 Tax=Eubacterium sp. TaxID=142586 RepID=UPI0035224032